MASIIRSQAADITYNMTATSFDLPGYRIVSNLGVVRGVVVRSRSVFGTIGASGLTHGFAQASSGVHGGASCGSWFPRGPFSPLLAGGCRQF